MKRSLNLMSDRALHRTQWRQGVRLWSKVFAVVSLLLSLWGFTAWRSCQLELQRQAIAEVEYEPTWRLRSEVTRMKNELAELTKQDQIPLALSQHQPALGLIGLAARQIDDRQEKLFIKRIELTRDPLGKVATQQPSLSFVVQGVTTEQIVADELAARLRELGPFSNVKLDLREQGDLQEKMQHEFNILCTY